MRLSGDMQTEAKWGREEGPVAFQRVYASYWQQEKTALEGMIANVGKFAKAVKKALKNLEAGDEGRGHETEPGGGRDPVDVHIGGEATPVGFGIWGPAIPRTCSTRTRGRSIIPWTGGQ